MMRNLVTYRVRLHCSIDSVVKLKLSTGCVSSLNGANNFFIQNSDGVTFLKRPLKKIELLEGQY
jgi:hypothetical protein